MKKLRKGMTWGIVICIIGIALREILAGFLVNQVIQNIVFMSFIIVLVVIFIVHGIQNDNYKKDIQLLKIFIQTKKKKHLKDFFQFASL